MSKVNDYTSERLFNLKKISSSTLSKELKNNIKRSHSPLKNRRVLDLNHFNNKKETEINTKSKFCPKTHNNFYRKKPFRQEKKNTIENSNKKDEKVKEDNSSDTLIFDIIEIPNFAKVDFKGEFYTVLHKCVEKVKVKKISKSESKKKNSPKHEKEDSKNRKRLRTMVKYQLSLNLSIIQEKNEISSTVENEGK